jgi:hypothetical protein
LAACGLSTRSWSTCPATTAEEHSSRSCATKQKHPNRKFVAAHSALNSPKLKKPSLS